MRIKHLTLAACLVTALPIFAIGAPASKQADAKDAPASEESIRELLQLSNAQQLLAGIKAQVDNMMSQTMQQAAQGRPVSPEKQAILDDMRAKIVALFDETLSWNALEPMYSRIYKAAFTQDEIDGIIKFYKTPAGKAMVKKLPVVMQHLMTEMQGSMQPMLQKMQEIRRDTIEKLKALPKDEASPALQSPPQQTPAH
jgi:uncharacterized protein